jgi:ABC-2 type transport system permease protein
VGDGRLEIDHLSKQYGDVVALRGTTFDVRAGELFEFVGLVQMVVIGGFSLAAALALEVLSISTSAAVGTVVWHLPGFVVYSLVFAELAVVLSVIPVFAPTLMPMRLAMGGVPVWEAVVSVGLVLVLIPALVWLAGRVYANAVMRSGARAKLKDALRPA